MILSNEDKILLFLSDGPKTLDELTYLLLLSTLEDIGIEEALSIIVAVKTSHGPGMTLLDEEWTEMDESMSYRYIGQYKFLAAGSFVFIIDPHDISWVVKDAYVRYEGKRYCKILGLDVEELDMDGDSENVRTTFLFKMCGAATRSRVRNITKKTMKEKKTKKR
jgi:hypothetical protein